MLGRRALILILVSFNILPVIAALVEEQPITFF
jgi:hypothetical protein